MTIPVPWIISALTFFGGIIVWFAKLSFERSLDQRDKRLEREEDRKELEARQREEEQRKRDEMIMRGLKTLTDCQYEVIYQMQTGHHNGGLDECLQDITEYRSDINDWILDLASSSHRR